MNEEKFKSIILTNGVNSDNWLIDDKPKMDEYIKNNPKITKSLMEQEQELDDALLMAFDKVPKLSDEATNNILNQIDILNTLDTQESIFTSDDISNNEKPLIIAANDNSVFKKILLPVTAMAAAMIIGIITGYGVNIDMNFIDIINVSGWNSDVTVEMGNIVYGFSNYGENSL